MGNTPDCSNQCDGKEQLFQRYINKNDASKNTEENTQKSILNIPNYFTLVHYIIIIQSKFRQYRAYIKYKNVKEGKLKLRTNEDEYIRLKLLSPKKRKKKVIIEDESSVTINNDNTVEITLNSSFNSNNSNNSKNSKKSKNSKNSLNSQNSNKSNNSYLSPNKIKGYFLLKTQKIKSFMIAQPPQLKFLKQFLTSPIQNFGKITWTDESKFLSKFQEKKSNGISQYIDIKNNIFFFGEYKNNKPRGYGIFTKSNGTRLEGYWLNNSLTGIGIEIWEDGTIYKGEFHLSKKNGIGLYRWPDGTIYEGEFKNDCMNGFGIIYYKDNKIYEGEIENGLMNGFGEFTWPDGKKYIGYYLNDLKNGFGIYIFDIVKFEVYIGFFKNGKMDSVGIKIKGNDIKYGVWKNGDKKFWLKGPWEMKSALYKKDLNKIESVKTGNEELISIKKTFTPYILPTLTMSMISEQWKEQEQYFKFMSKSLEFFKKFIHKIVDYKKKR